MVMTMVPMISYGASKPGKATIKAVTQMTGSTARVTWKSVSGAKGYSVYKATSRTGTYKRVINTVKKNYMSKSLTLGKTYWYKVRAYKISNGKKIYGSYSSAKSVTVLPIVGMTMADKLGADKTLTFTIDMTKVKGNVDLITSIQTTLANSRLFGFLVPNIENVLGDLVRKQRSCLNLFRQRTWQQVRQSLRLHTEAITL